jgi:hypothetical protein
MHHDTKYVNFGTIVTAKQWKVIVRRSFGLSVQLLLAFINAVTLRFLARHIHVQEFCFLLNVYVLRKGLSFR